MESSLKGTQVANTPTTVLAERRYTKASRGLVTGYPQPCEGRLRLSKTTLALASYEPRTVVIPTYFCMAIGAPV